MLPVHILGLGVNARDLPPSYSRLIREAEVLAGGSRQLENFADHKAQRIVLKAPLDKRIEQIKQARDSGRMVVVLADGDPTFFGIGTKLLQDLGTDRIRVYPNVTTLQAAAARIFKPWAEIKTISLHGRGNIGLLLRALAGNKLVGVFTDQNFNPGFIAEELLQRKLGSFTIHIFEDMETEKERVRSLSLDQAQGEGFSPLNFVVLERMNEPEIKLTLGLEDSLYVHDRGMITKKEVRSAVLANLGIRACDTVWDLGAGCGSVAVEASLLAGHGRVLAVEKEAGRAEMIRENIRRTAAFGVEVIQSAIRDCIDYLELPDRIFIGGGLSKDEDLLHKAYHLLKPGGRMVASIVLSGTLSRALDLGRNSGWNFQLVNIQVCRSEPLGDDLRMVPVNPVNLMVISKGQ